jgi:tetratricopeptide (TPR) repeat protein
MAILIADLYYESEQHPKALSIYQRLENRELGTLSKNELAYVMLGIFSCLCWEKKFDETAYLFHKAKLFEGTPSEARAYFYYGNRIRRIGGMEGYKLAIRAYEVCIQKYPESKEAANARLYLAETYKDLGNKWLMLNRQDIAKQCYTMAYEQYKIVQIHGKSEKLNSQLVNILKEYEKRGFTKR